MVSDILQILLIIRDAKNALIKFRISDTLIDEIKEFIKKQHENLGIKMF